MTTANSILKGVQNNGAGDIVSLPDGTRIRILPVSAALLERVSRAIPNPVPPTYFDEATNRNLPNVADPDYIRAVGEAEEKRNAAAVDALVMFGIELVDGVPEDERWIKRLAYLEKRLGHIVGLDDFDLDDAMDREYLFKRLILASGNVLEMVTRASGVSQDDVRAAEDSFRGK